MPEPGAATKTEWNSPSRGRCAIASASGTLSRALHAGECAVPHEMDVALLEGGDDSGVVRLRHVAHLHARFLGEVLGQVVETRFQQAHILIGDAGDKQFLLFFTRTCNHHCQ